MEGQQAHVKMLNITNHQGNANQNHNEISPHTCQNDYQSKSLQITNVGKDVEKREPSNIVGVNINWYSHCEKQYGGFSNIKNRVGPPWWLSGEKPACQCRRHGFDS